MLANPRKVNLWANNWLALFLFSFACTLFDRITDQVTIHLEYPHLLGITELTRLVMAPAMYFSVLYFTSPDRKFTKTDCLHLLPALLLMLYLAPFYSNLPNRSDMYYCIREWALRLIHTWSGLCFRINSCQDSVLTTVYLDLENECVLEFNSQSLFE